MLKLKPRPVGKRGWPRWSYDTSAPARLRKAANLSLLEASARSGKSKGTLNMLERGVTRASADTIGVLAHVYDVDPNAFFAHRNHDGGPA